MFFTFRLYHVFLCTLVNDFHRLDQMRRFRWDPWSRGLCGVSGRERRGIGVGDDRAIYSRASSRSER